MQSLVYALRYAAGRIRAKELKQQLFSFLKYLGDVDAAVSAFWDEKFGLVGQWYLAQKRDDDIIISASPEFLLLPVCARSPLLRKKHNRNILFPVYFITWRMSIQSFIYAKNHPEFG